MIRKSIKIKTHIPKLIPFIFILNVATHAFAFDNLIGNWQILENSATEEYLSEHNKYISIINLEVKVNDKIYDGIKMIPTRYLFLNSYPLMDVYDFININGGNLLIAGEYNVGSKHNFITNVKYNDGVLTKETIHETWILWNRTIEKSILILRIVNDELYLSSKEYKESGEIISEYNCKYKRLSATKLN